jgi:hypothetical protein
MMEWTEKAQAQLNATGIRVEEIASGVGVVQQESRSGLQAAEIKVGELFSLLQSSGPASAPTFAAPAPQPSAQAQPPVDFMAGGNDAWAQSRQFGGMPMRASIATPPTFDPPRVNGRWALYDEKYIMHPGLASNKFDGKSPQTWLQSTRDYIAGRTSELDPLLDWVEA